MVCCSVGKVVKEYTTMIIVYSLFAKTKQNIKTKTKIHKTHYGHTDENVSFVILCAVVKVIARIIITVH